MKSFLILSLLFTSIGMTHASEILDCRSETDENGTVIRVFHFKNSKGLDKIKIANLDEATGKEILDLGVFSFKGKKEDSKYAHIRGYSARIVGVRTFEKYLDIYVNSKTSMAKAVLSGNAFYKNIEFDLKCERF